MGRLSGECRTRPIAINTYVSAVSSGQTLSGVTLTQDEDVTVYRGGTIESATVLKYARVDIQHGGSALDLLASGGYIGLEGHATGTTITAGGTLQIYSGLATSSLVLSGGTESVGNYYTGGSAQALDTVLGYGGVQRVGEAGSAGKTRVHSGALLQVGGGGVVSAAEILSGGELSGGATDVTIYGGGQAYVFGGEQLTGTLTNGATLIVDGSYNNGPALLTGLTALSGATVVLLEGGTESGLTFAPGAVVESGIVAVYSATGAASLLVAAGDTLSGNTVGSGETEQVNPNGIASATLVVNGGAQIISSGGIAVGAVLRDGGRQTLTYSGGTASGTEVLSGGYQGISGGRAIDTTVYAGGEQYLYFETQASGTVLSGGVQVVDINCRSVETQVRQAGAEINIDAGTTVDTVVSAGGVEENAQGTASGTTVLAGGQLLNMDFLAALVSATVESGGLFVLSGPSEAVGFSATVVESGAHLVLFDGATTSGIDLHAGAIVTSVDVAVFSGTAQAPSDRFIVGGVTFSGGVIGPYGSEDIAAGGAVASTTIASAAFQNLQGGTAYATIVQSGGEQNIYEPAGMVAAVATVIESGGLQDVTTAEVDRTTIEAGGALIFYNSATADNLTFEAGGTLDLESLQYRSGGHATLTTGNQLVVFEGGTRVEIQLVGDYTGEQFYTYDFDGRTQVTLSAASATAVAAGPSAFLPGAAVHAAPVIAAPAVGATVHTASTAVEQDYFPTTNRSPRLA